MNIYKHSHPRVGIMGTYILLFEFVYFLMENIVIISKN